MAKILGCLSKDFDSFVTSWSILSEEISLEQLLEKLANAERNIEGRPDNASDVAYKSQSKSHSQETKAVGKKFKGVKCVKLDI